MHIGIVVTSTTSAGGIYQYTRNIIATLYASSGCACTVFILPDCQIDLSFIDRPDWTVAVMDAEIITAPLVLHCTRQEALDGVNIYGSDTSARRFFEQFGIDLLFYPAPSSLSFECGIPYIMAVHDLQHRLHPEFHEVSAEGEWDRREYLFRNGIRFAHGILVDSEVGRDDLITCYLDIAAPEKIHVLPFAPTVFAQQPEDAALTEASVRSKYGLQGGYFFYPAQFWSHKNHARLISALAVLRSEYGADFMLVLVGSYQGPPHERRQEVFDTVWSQAYELQVADLVQYLGYVSDGEMQVLYEHAVALVMPTFFGPTNIPVLEAWAAGCPVITSDIRGVREQVADAGLLVDPTDAHAIARAMHAVAVDGDLRAALREKGRARLAQCSLDSFKGRVLQILDDLTARQHTLRSPEEAAGDLQGRRIQLYVCQRGRDFDLPDHLYSEIGYLSPSNETANQFFEFVTSLDRAQYVFFPCELSQMLQQHGVQATAELLRRILPSFHVHESRYILWSYEDTSLPLELDSIIFQVSLNRILHDRSAIALPYPIQDPLQGDDLQLEAMLYHSSFVGHPSSHPMRVQLADLLSREHRLQLYVETTPLHHYHLPAEEQKLRKEHYFQILRQSLTVLCPRGAAENTIRFFETLAHGRIPVLISDQAVLPLESVIPYDDFVIRVPESRLEQVADYILAWLGCRTEQQIHAACRQARDVWNRWLRSEEYPALVAHELTMRLPSQVTGTDVDQKILVSAIVSTYNAAAFIKGCIEDLEQQTIADEIEIIVIDSASPQNEGEIVRELQERYHNIRYLRTEQRETVYAAWNRGIAMARGRYLTNANTDDRHRADAFEVMVKTLEALPEVDLVYADVLVTQLPNQTFEQHTVSGRYDWHAWDRNVLLDTGCFIGPQPMWRCSLHELYGGFDASYITSGDYEFWLRISQTSRFQHIAQPLGLYLARPDSIEHANEVLKQQENAQVRERYRTAASQKRLVGLRPLELLQTLLQETAPSADTEEIGQTVVELDRLLEQLMPDRMTLPDHLARLRQELLTQQHGQQQLLQYLDAIQQFILQGQEWFMQRSGNRKEDESQMLSPLQNTLQQARILGQRGEIDQAVTLLLNRGIRVAPDDPASYQVLAELLIAAGRYEDALEVLPEMPPSTDPGLKLELAAVCHCAIGEDEAARQLALQVLQHSRAQVVLGTLAARQGDLPRAEQLFRQAVAGSEACAAGWLALGMLLWGQRRQLEAWQALYRALAAEAPRDEPLQIALDMAERLECQPELCRLLDELVIRWPDSRELARHHALLLGRSSQTDRSLAACETFLARFGVDEELLEVGVALRNRFGLYERCANGGSASISLCMIVKNEEKQLARCLASVKPVVHELVVVDTGSTDRTVAIAEVFGAQVVRHAWHDDYAAARNAGLAEARAQWILVLDADEVLSSRDYRLLAQAAGDEATAAWQITTRNYVHQPTCQGWQPSIGEYPDEELAEGWYPSVKVRLFRHDPRIRFEGVVHEMVEPALRASGYAIRNAGFVVHHYGELDMVAMLDKKERYYRLGLAKLEQSPDNPLLLAELAVQSAELGRLEESLVLWDRLLERQPDNPEGLFNRGGVLLLLKRYHEAADASRRATQVLPALKEAWLNLVNASIALNDLATAKTGLVRLSALAPDYPPLWAAGLAFAVVLGDNAGATRYAERLREQGYGVSGMVLQRANELLEAGQHRLAAALYAWLQEGIR